MAGGTNLAEYMVSLTANIDNQGIGQILSILDTLGSRGVKLTATLTGATTAIYKLVESATKEEFRLKELAKTQKKTTEEIRASETALKKMGMTLNDIKKDASLKAIYDDLKKFNKEMEMPNMENALKNVRNLQASFWKMGSAIEYLVQQIGQRVLINLEAPIKRITKNFNSVAEWLKKNLNNVATKIGQYITAFAKGVIGIVEGFQKITDLVDRLPASVKGIGGAILAVIALLKSGPIGQILALVSIIGDTIHDFENYQWNQQNLKNPQWWDDGKGGYTDKYYEGATPYQIRTGPLTPVWEILMTDADDKTKATQIWEKVFSGLEEALKNVINKLNGNDLGLKEWLTGENSPISNALDGIKAWFEDENNAERFRDFIQSLALGIASLLKKAGEIGLDITASVADFIGTLFGGVDWKDSKINAALSGDNGIAVGLTAAIETALLGGNFLTSVIAGVLGGYQTEREKAIKSLYEKDHPGEIIDWDKILYTDLEKDYGADPRLAGMLSEGLQDSFNKTIGGVMELLVGGLKFVGDTAGKLTKGLLKSILMALGQTDESTAQQALDEIGDKNVIWNGLSTAIATWFAGGNFFTGLITGISSMLAGITDENGNFDWSQLEESAKEFWDFILTIWEGPMKEDGSGRTGDGLGSLFRKLWEGEDGSGGIRKFAEDIAGQIGTWLEPIKNAISDWFSSLWINIWNGAPDWVRTALGFVNIKDPNSSKVTLNDDNTYTFSSTTGEDKTVPKEVGEALADFAPYLKVENGQFKLTGEYADKGGYINPLTGQTLNDYINMVANSPDADATALRNKLIDNGVVPELGVEVKTDDAKQQVQDFIGEIDGKTVTISLAVKPDGTSDLGDLWNDPNFQSAWKEGKFTISGSPYYGISTEQETRARNLFNEALAKQSLKYDENGHLWYGDENGDYSQTDKDEEIEAAMGKVEGVFISGSGDLDAALGALEAAMDAAGLKGAADALVQAINEAAARISASGAGEGGPNSALGGRFASKQKRTLGEDGAEYIIPVTKGQRGVDLTIQAMSEMGSNAVRSILSHFGFGEGGDNGAAAAGGIVRAARGMTERLTEDFGIGTHGSLGSSVDAIASALSNIQPVNNYTITAPVNINVTSSGADAQDIGNGAYSAAERHLVRTLRGVVS